MYTSSILFQLQNFISSGVVVQVIVGNGDTKFAFTYIDGENDNTVFPGT